VQRILQDETGQLADQFVVMAEPEIRLHPLLDRREALFLQMSTVCQEMRSEPYAGQGRTAPDPQTATQQHGRLVVGAGGQCVAPQFGAAQEGTCVVRSPAGRQPVTPAGERQYVRRHFAVVGPQCLRE
jgi:hypothetical protein